MDLIDRQAAIDALGERPTVWIDDDEYSLGQRNQYDCDKLAIETVPSAQPEPCKDAVSRKAVSEWLKQYGQDVLHGKYKFSLMYIWKNLMDLPSAHPEQRAHGHWVHRGCGVFECDQCGKLVSTNVYKSEKASDSFKFCPECGAGMRGEQDA